MTAETIMRCATCPTEPRQVEVTAQPLKRLLLCVSASDYSTYHSFCCRIPWAALVCLFISQLQISHSSECVTLTLRQEYVRGVLFCFTLDCPLVLIIVFRGEPSLEVGNCMIREHNEVRNMNKVHDI